MFLFLTIFVILLLIQLVYGMYAWNLRRILHQKYKYAIGEQLEVADLLEKYMEDESYTFNLEPTNEIVEPAFAESRHLYINKKSIYGRDLYNLFYIIFQAEMTKDQYDVLRKLPFAQNILFIVQIIFFVAALAIQNEYNEIMIIIALAVAIGTIIISVGGLFLMDTLLYDAQEVASAILNLDDVEEARTSALRNDLRFVIFEYPFEILWRIYQFFKP